jgi:hypothetical protein
VIAADGAVVYDDIPCPERDGIPLHSVSVRTMVHPSATPTFLTSKRFLSPVSALAPALATFALGAGASFMSTSAMAAVEAGLVREAGCGELWAAVFAGVKVRGAPKVVRKAWRVQRRRQTGMGGG